MIKTDYILCRNRSAAEAEPINNTVMNYLYTRNTYVQATNEVCKNHTFVVRTSYAL